MSGCVDIEEMERNKLYGQVCNTAALHSRGYGFESVRTDVLRQEFVFFAGSPSKCRRSAPD